MMMFFPSSSLLWSICHYKKLVRNRQSIELIINEVHYLLLGAVHDIDRANSDMSFPSISEIARVVELAILDRSNDDIIDAGRRLNRSGSNSSHGGLSL